MLVLIPENLPLGVFEFQFFGLATGLVVQAWILSTISWIWSLRSWDADESWVVNQQQDGRLAFYSTTLQAFRPAHVKRLPKQTRNTIVHIPIFSATARSSEFTSVSSKVLSRHNPLLPALMVLRHLGPNRLPFAFVFACAVFSWKGAMQANKISNRTVIVCLPWVPSKDGSDNKNRPGGNDWNKSFSRHTRIYIYYIYICASKGGWCHMYVWKINSMSWSPCYFTTSHWHPTEDSIWRCFIGWSFQGDTFRGRM